MGKADRDTFTSDRFKDDFIVLNGGQSRRLEDPVHDQGVYRVFSIAWYRTGQLFDFLSDDPVDQSKKQAKRNCQQYAECPRAERIQDASQY